MEGEARLIFRSLEERIWVGDSSYLHISLPLFLSLRKKGRGGDTPYLSFSRRDDMGSRSLGLGKWEGTP